MIELVRFPISSRGLEKVLEKHITGKYHLAKREVFTSLEGLLQAGKVCLHLNFDLVDGIDDGPMADKYWDESWDNKAHPTLAIKNFRLTNVPQPMQSDLHERRLPKALSDDIDEQVEKVLGPLGDDFLLRDEPDIWRTKQIAITLANGIAYRRLDNPSTRGEFQNRVAEAMNFLARVRGELNPLVIHSTNYEEAHKSAWARKKSSLGGDPHFNANQLVWFHREAENGIMAGEKLRLNYKGSQSALCFEYLAKPWMDSPGIEIDLVDAMIYDTTMRQAETLNPPWLRRLGIAVKVFLSVFVALVVVDAYGIGIALLAGLSAWLMLTLKAGKKPQDESKRLLNEMIAVGRLFADTRISPEFVKQRLIETANLGARWPSGLIAIVEHAAKRNPVKWC